jgi:hypothetical protein
LASRHSREPGGGRLEVGITCMLSADEPVAVKSCDEENEGTKRREVRSSNVVYFACCPMHRDASLLQRERERERERESERQRHLT